MSVLAKKYEGKIRFAVKSAHSEEGRDAAAEYDFGGAMHGLVGLDLSGEPKIVMPGHDYTQEDIEAKLQELLN